MIRALRGGRVVREQARSVVRVLAADGATVVGAGFLIGPDLVATCAHVVAEAVTADPYAPAPPPASILLDFPLLREPDGAPATAHVHRWSPIAADGSGDVAVLRLHRPAPDGARMPPLRRVDALWDHGFRVLGFPEGLADGVWTTGRIRGEQGTRWFQLQGTPGDQGIVGGFSGSPVWDDESGAVVGMTVAADRSAETTTAYLIPIDQVLGLDPELLPCPYRGLEPFGEEHAAFFFGRDADLRRLVDAVAGQPLVAVAGPSGVGKSSLVRAGLLPRERDAGTRIAELRVAAGTEPAAALAAALAPVLRTDLTPEAVAARLGAPDPQVRAADARSLVPDASGPGVLLFVDQFEELAATEPDAARELLLLVTDIVGAGNAAGAPDTPPVRAVLTVRWESLAELLAPDTDGRTGPAPPDRTPHPALDAVLDAGSALVAGAVLVGPMDRGRLRDAVVRPAERAPGLSFEPGLVDRILDDAGNEPGQLPLVESLLTELWERRSGGSLTVAAYEAAGGVAGAVAKRAEELLAEHPDPDDQVRLRRLFTLLAQPDRDGRFVRRPVPLAELPPELHTLVAPLVAGRLLVVQRARGRGDTLELAHQALIRHWPRLQGWLADDRDFLAWRAQLGQQRERWEAAEQDPGALLRGTALAAAAQWLPARETEVSAVDLEYLRRSRARQRREVRRWRVVTAVLAVLVLAAGGLAVVALDRGNRLDERLRVANAENLAQRARVAAPTDPDLAARLALAAWQADPDNAQARSALATSYFALQAVQDVYPDLAGAPIDAFGTSADGDTAVLPGPNGGAVIATGLAAGSPRRWELPDLAPGAGVRLSRDGRTAIGIDADGELRRWDVASQARTDLRPPAPGIDPLSVAGSPTLDRLAWFEETPTGRRVVVFDTATRREVTNSVPSIPASGAAGVYLTADPTVVLLGFGRLGWSERFEMRSLSDGALLWTSAEDSVRVGDAIATCVAAPDATGTAVLVVTGTDSRVPEERRRIPLAGSLCHGLMVAVGSGYVIEQRSRSAAGSAVLARLLRVSDGATFDVVLPPDADLRSDLDTFSLNTRMGVATAADGAVSVLRTSGTSLLRIAATPEPVRAGAQPALQSLGGGGRYLVAVERHGYATYDRATGRLLGSIAGAELPHRGRTQSSVDGDELTLVIDAPDGWFVDRYTLPDFTLAGSYRLPTPDAPREQWGGAGARTADGLLYAVGDGRLSAWDTSTHAPVAEPMAVAIDPSVNSMTLRPRPGHPGEVAIRTADGAIEVWEVVTGHRVARLQPPPEQRVLGYSFAFDGTGERVVVLTQLQTMLVWDVGTQQLVRPPIPLPAAGIALGFDAEGHVVTAAETTRDATRVTLWDLGLGREAGSIEVASYDLGDITADGRVLELPGYAGAPPAALPLTGSAWRDHLCAFSDRPFGPGEHAALPLGVEAGSPCS